MEFISTSGHGYLKVTLNQLIDAMQEGFEPTGYSYLSFTHAFLEEDVDASNFLEAMGIDYTSTHAMKDTHQKDIDRESKFSSGLAEDLESAVRFKLFADELKKLRKSKTFKRYSVAKVQTLSQTYVVVGVQGKRLVVKDTYEELWRLDPIYVIDFKLLHW